MIETLPDALGHFGVYGGMFVPETLMTALHELAAEYERAKNDAQFQNQLARLLRDFAGRPTPLYFAERLTKKLGGAKIYLKREDLLHTGAHKINNALGQILLAQRMGKNRIIAETGAGQHGVATATVAARFGCECVVYMGAVDMERQALNVLGSHPYPMMVRDFQRVIGEETRKQIFDREQRLPDLLVACVGGGSNAIGLFHPFLSDASVRMVGVEAGGEGIRSGKHAARFQGGRLGVLQGTKTFLLANEDGQIELTHSVSAGLDYAAVGPEHSYLREIGRVEYDFATDDEALAGFKLLSETEGIIPALETAHAVAHIAKVAPKMSVDKIIVMNCSGRGDKDVATAAKHLLSSSRAQSRDPAAKPLR